MFYGNSRSKIVHYQQCGYASRSKACESTRLRQFYTLDEARTAGYRMCKCCDPVAKRFKPELDEISRFCGKNNIFYRISNGEMEIITLESHWKVCMGARGKMVLYHQNRFGDKYDRRNYHIQQYQVTGAMPMLRYIITHDKYTAGKQEAKSKEKQKSPKGSKKYAAMVKEEKAREIRRSIKRTLDLINALEAV